jgi:hypothetical protein
VGPGEFVNLPTSTLDAPSPTPFPAVPALLDVVPIGLKLRLSVNLSNQGYLGSFTMIHCMAPQASLIRLFEFPDLSEEIPVFILGNFIPKLLLCLSRFAVF